MGNIFYHVNLHLFISVHVAGIVHEGSVPMDVGVEHLSMNLWSNWMELIEIHHLQWNLIAAVDALIKVHRWANDEQEASIRI